MSIDCSFVQQVLDDPEKMSPAQFILNLFSQANIFTNGTDYIMDASASENIGKCIANIFVENKVNGCKSQTAATVWGYVVLNIFLIALLIYIYMKA